MTNPKVDFKTVLSDLEEENSRNSSSLTLEELMAWREGNLSGGEKQAMQRRLVLDKDAVRTLLALAAKPPEENISASWSAIEPRIGEIDTLVVTQPTAPADPPENQNNRVRPVFLYPIMRAAIVVLMITTVGFGFKVRELNLRVADLLRADDPVALIKPVGPGPAVVFIGSTQRSEFLDLTLAEPHTALLLDMNQRWDSLTRWRVTITDPAGRIVLDGESESLQRRIMLELEPKRFPQPGKYRLEVFGIKKDTPPDLLDSVFLNIKLK